MRILAAALTLAATPVEDDRFNCPKPEGNISMNERAWINAWPTHIDRLIPHRLTIDVRCGVDGEGTFVDCIFESREPLTESQKRIVYRAVPKILAGSKTDVPNQRCVATKLTILQGDKYSVPSPDEPAAEGEIPD